MNPTFTIYACGDRAENIPGQIAPYSCPDCGAEALNPVVPR